MLPLADKRRYSQEELLDYQKKLDDRVFDFIREEPFLGYCGKIITKVIDTKIDTLCISYDKDSKFVTLRVNPEFFFELSTKKQRGCLSHEYLHFILSHITSRLPPKEQNHLFDLHNIAMDLAVNSIVGMENLPDFAFFPGPTKRIPSDVDPNSWQYSFLQYIQKLPVNESYEWYFSKLLEFYKKNPQPNPNQSLGMPLDDHSEFGQGDSSGKSKSDSDSKSDVNNEGTDGNGKAEGSEGKTNEDKAENEDGDNEIMETLIENIVKDAIQNSESSNNWGSIPQSIVQELKNKFSKEIPWQTLLKQFVARSRTNNYTSTVKRLSKKMPYILPGNQRDVTSSIVVFEDQSGSMGKEVLERICDELDSLAEIANFDFYSFDTSIDKKNLRKFKKGQRIQNIKRTRRGGTSYKEIPIFLDSPIGRGYDCAIIVTDGMAPSMQPTKKKVLWIFTEKNPVAKPSAKDVVCYLPKKEMK